jgi:hypothetical protein
MSRHLPPGVVEDRTATQRAELRHLKRREAKLRTITGAARQAREFAV